MVLRGTDGEYFEWAIMTRIDRLGMEIVLPPGKRLKPGSLWARIANSFGTSQSRKQLEFRDVVDEVGDRQRITWRWEYPRTGCTYRLSWRWEPSTYVGDTCVIMVI
jgi:hypothetical protein